MIFNGIAIGGHKAAGKDTLAAYILRTRGNARIVRSKTPIVEAFEKHYRVTYDKQQHDQQLMDFSKHIARKQNPRIVAEWLAHRLPALCAQGEIPIVADMRFHDENAAVLDAGFACIKVFATERACKSRILAREGTLANYRPDDPTEIEIDDLKYHYEVNNTRDDDGRQMLWQFEDVIRRLGAGFARSVTLPLDTVQPIRVRVVDHTSTFWFDIGTMVGTGIKSGESPYGIVEMDEDAKTRHFPLTDLIEV